MSNEDTNGSDELANLLDLLERSTEIVVKMSKSLTQPGANGRPCPRYLKCEKELKQLRQEDMRPKLMIAICGASGAGKSSLINSLLGATLVPTSGLRACTAVPIEINYHDEPKHKAVITFLSRDEWEEDLASLLDDFRDENGGIVDLNHCSDIVQAARDKVSAVYPDLKAIMHNPARLAELTVETLMETDTRLTHHLDTTQTIQDANAKKLSATLRKLVVAPHDSTKGGPWPLIKKVQIYSKADVLATGAVLVDLPGTGDSNKARNCVAEDYMSKCERYWVVAPIDRILDSESVKDLLSEGLKLRLANGALLSKESITVIATKSEMNEANGLIAELELQDDEEIVRLDENISQLEEEVEQSDVDSEFSDDDLNIVVGHKRKRSSRDVGIAVSERRSKERRLEQYKREKNSYCALKRTMYIKDNVKQLCYDILSGYDADVGNATLINIDGFELQVFCTSAKDYDLQRSKKPKSSEPIYFANIEDTQIPALQNWTHELTIPGRKDAISSNIRSTQDKFKWIKNVTEEMMIRNSDGSEDGVDPPGEIFLRLEQMLRSANDANKQAIKHHCVDIMHREHENATNAAAQESEKIFWELLDPIKKWTAFNVVLKCGVYKKKPINIDLNDALLSPYMKKILPQWGAISESVGFASFLSAIERDIKHLVEDLGKNIKSESDITAKQQEIWERAHPTVMDYMSEAKKIFLQKKKFIGRDLSTDVLQKSLKKGYKIALRLNGKGSLQRRKDSLVTFVHEQRQDIFAACINHLVTPLYVVIDEIIGQFLQDKLQGLAKEIELSIMTWLSPENTISKPSTILYYIEQHDRIVTKLRETTSV